MRGAACAERGRIDLDKSFGEKRMKRCRIGLSALTGILAWLFAGMALRADAPQQTIYNSPYVSFSPDGQAWTTNAGDRDIRWYGRGETVYTGIFASLAEPKAGEHYYDKAAAGTISVGRWEVEWQSGQCIHTSYPLEGEDYHGISFERHVCGAKHYSGWVPYCADCGEKISDGLVYMSREAAETIGYIPLGMDYYSLCPFCGNLEQGRAVWHTCKAVSANMYRVIYDGNFPADAKIQRGYMGNSLHMYNDAAEYEGHSVTQVKELTQNAYECIGYRFIGWNTKPDGSGSFYGDKAVIRNLTTENWNGQPGRSTEGTVILYAQWKAEESTLLIDPNGGTYGGKEGMTEITKPYGEIYIPDASLVEPPPGYQATFEVNGGTAIKPVRAVGKFREWSMIQPFQGTFLDGVYLFHAPEGSTDTLRAVYEQGSIELPPAEREGYSFGGWYFDPEFQYPAGGAGDSIFLTGNLTLYAQWVGLALTAADNYSAFGGSGAVDLSWQMSDGRNKTYLLYQRREGEGWTKVSTADDISSEVSAHAAMSRTGREEQYTVPYTGIYTISLSGAQGGGYGDCEGGKGGSVELKLWLERNEILTFVVGGKDSFNGGGQGSIFGNGGGCTVLSSDKKGVIAVAGGGGGASEAGNGGAGGSAAALLASGYTGESGMAGGGGGYLGGAAGEYIVHEHIRDCYEEVSGTVTAGADFYHSLSLHNPGQSTASIYASGAGVFTRIYANSQNPVLKLQVGSNTTYLETPGSGVVTFSDDGLEDADVWGNTANNAATAATIYFLHEDGSVSSRTVNTDELPHQTTVEKEVWFKDGSYELKRNVIKKSYFTDVFWGQVTTRESVNGQEPSGTWRGAPAVYDMSGTYSFEVGEDVKGVYVEVSRWINDMEPECWMNLGIQNLCYRYEGKRLQCGYEEGQVESSMPSYGGSSYVNPDAVIDFSMTAGSRVGDGCAVLDSVLLGFHEELTLEAVKATDLAQPCAVSQEEVRLAPTDNSRVAVSWQRPSDRGTVYCHKAEAYLKGTSSRLCTSNLTRNILVSGVAGYYYVVDENGETRADESGGYIATEHVEIALSEGTRYLHLAAVDVAGNVGETTHIKLDAGEVPWDVGTRQLQIEPGENVYAADEKTFYVRCDGVTPFLLLHSGYRNGPATKSGQLVYSVFASALQGTAPGNSILVTPLSDSPEADGEARTADVTCFTEGEPLLRRYPYSLTRRSDRGRSLEAWQKFTLDLEAHGQRIEVVPRIGAVFWKSGEQKTYYSALEKDTGNGIILIGDAEGPVVQGMETLSDGQLIDRGEETIRIFVTAADDLSGMAEFYVEVKNEDNHSMKRYDSEGGAVEIEITAVEPLFTGDFSVTAYARDNVGNVTEVSRFVTEFALDAEIERILAPHEPVFKGGESGILSIVTYGYADRVEVEFPPELAVHEESMRMVFDYTDMQLYRQESQVQFMVPLYTPTDREYTVKVRAFKEGRELECNPVLHIRLEGGDVLDEFRTRLR